MPFKNRWTGSGFAPAQANFGVGTVTNNLTATGSTQGTALAISDDVNVFTTVAASTGCILPSSVVASAGDRLNIANFGANALNVYPPTGGRINNGTVNAAVTVGTNATREFMCIDGTNWAAI